MGVGGEKENAQELLEKLMTKYNLTLEEIEEDRQDFFLFKYANEEEELLLRQIVRQEKGAGYPAYTQKNKRMKTGFYLTKTEYVYLSAKYDFYLHEWRKHIALAMKAFIFANNLVINSENPNKQEFSEEEKRDMLKALLLSAHIEKKSFDNSKMLGEGIEN